MPLPSPYVSKCGRVLFFYTGGLPPTAVPSPPPTVSVNGTPVPLAAPYWDANTKYQPWIAFALPAPVLATDVVTYDLPAGWMSTSKGPAAASSGTADNFTGQLEPGFSGITPTMKLGVNVIGPGAKYWSSYSPQANIARRLGTFWGSGVTVTPDGMPLAMPTGKATQLLWTTTSNGIDRSLYPGITGDYTVVWDEVCLASPSDIRLSSTNPEVSVVRKSSSPGNQTGIVAYDMAVVFTITYTADKPKSRDLALSVTISNPSLCSSVANLRIFLPGDEDADPDGPSGHLLRWLTAMAPKTVGPLRYMANTGSVNSAIDVGDMRATGQFSWCSPTSYGHGTSRAIPLLTVGPLTSTTIFAHQAYGAPDQTHYAAPEGSPGPYQFAIPAGWPKQSGWPAIELTTGAPHGLKTGQYVTLPATGMPRPISGKSGPVYVTSPTSFAFIYWGEPIPAVTTLPTDGSIKATFQLPEAGTIPHETACAITKAVGGEHWVNVPTALSDVAVRTLAVKIFHGIPAGKKVWVESGNEEWNWQYGGTMFRSAVGLLIGQSYIANGASRAVQVHQLFMEVAAKLGREADVVRVHGGFMFDPNNTTTALQRANAMGSKIDAVALSPYVDAPGFLARAAKGLLDGSVTVPMYCDLLRHTYRYDSRVAWALSAHLASIAKLSPTTQLVSYEGGPQVLIPSGAAPGDSITLAKLSHDVIYHPAFYDCEMTHFQVMQQGGLTTHVPLGLTYMPTWSGTVWRMWGMTVWPGQVAGDGSGNVFAIGDGRAHDCENASVRLKAWTDWASAAN